MLRVILVVDPQAEQTDAIAAALEATPLTSVHVSDALRPVAEVLAAPHTLEPSVHQDLQDAEGALRLIASIAEATEGTVALVAPSDVVRGVLVRALDAPVPDGRLALEPGTIAEVEVRLDAPWTVNRINDGCHLGG